MELLPHQSEAVSEFVRRDGRMLLWADVGTGKTAIAISCVKELSAKTIYFCPAILKSQVASEFGRFAPDLVVRAIEGTTKERRAQWREPADVFVANYELLLVDLDAMMKFDPDMVVADECQRLAAPSSKSLKAFRRLTPKYRLPMSGTPAPNKLHEFWNMTDWVSPGHFHETFWQFRSRECRMHTAFPQILGYYDLDKVQARFMAQVHRIRREDVLTLPPLTEVRIPVTMGKTQRDAYVKLKKELLLELADGKTLTVPSLLALLMRLRQLATCPEALGVAVPSAKEEALAELLRMTAPKKTLVFTEFATAARSLAGAHKALAVTGETPQKERDAMFERFRTDPGAKLLFLTSAAQYGVNLQAAEVVIHLDLPWNDARVDQRNARAWRYGQDKPVTSYRLVATGTVDEKMEAMVESKRKATVEDLKKFFL